MTRFLTALAAGTVLGTAYLGFPAMAAETAPLPSASAEAQSTESTVALPTAAGETAAAPAQVDAASAARLPIPAPVAAPRVKRTVAPVAVRRAPRPAYRVAARNYRVAARYERVRHCVSLGCPGYVVMGVAY
jgi:hypothetical protein